jgi:Zinc knuckle
MTLRQNQLSVQQYYESFTNLLSVYIHCGGSTEPDPGCQKYVAGKLGIEVGALTAAQKTEIREMTWANWFVNHSDKNWFGSLIIALHNEYLNGNDNYPKTMTDAYTCLINYKDPLGGVRVNNASTGVSFANDGVESKQKKGKKNKDHITCHKCKQNGHYANECPGISADTVNATTATTETTDNVTEPADSGECNHVSSTMQFTLTNVSHQIPSTWILLDNQSTIDVFSNKDLLSNIHNCNRVMNIHCNAGVKQTSKMGTLARYGEVWYHANGIANILSLSRARNNGFTVSYDNNTNIFSLTRTTDPQQQHQFRQSEGGLYFLDTAGKDGFTFINTLTENKSKFSNRDYLRAVAARKLLCKIGRPSMQTFLRILDRNQLANCPVTRRDALNAEIMFGPDLGSLKGKTVRRPGLPAHPILNDLVRSRNGT